VVGVLYQQAAVFVLALGVLCRIIAHRLCFLLVDTERQAIPAWQRYLATPHYDVMHVGACAPYVFARLALCVGQRSRILTALRQDVKQVLMRGTGALVDTVPTAIRCSALIRAALGIVIQSLTCLAWYFVSLIFYQKILAWKSFAAYVIQGLVGEG